MTRKEETLTVQEYETPQATLERLVDQQIILGLKNPHDFFTVIATAIGDEQIAALARPYLADFVAEMARQKLNAARRASVARITTDALADPEVKLRSLWVPSAQGGGITYKRIADMSADDFDARAAYLERMMFGIARHAAWCRAVAEELRRHNCATANELAVLPPLPEIDDQPPALPVTDADH